MFTPLGEQSDVPPAQVEQGQSAALKPAQPEPTTTVSKA